MHTENWHNVHSLHTKDRVCCYAILYIALVLYFDHRKTLYGYEHEGSWPRNAQNEKRTKMSVEWPKIA